MIIGLTGPKLSGKGTAATYLTAKHSAVVYSMSGILGDVARRLYLEHSRSNLIALATALRSQFGEAILARVLTQDIERAQPQLAVIDGIRMPQEVDIFSTLPDFHLIYIDAPLRTRYERALGRGEKAGESEMTFEEFVAEEAAVTEQHIESLKERANTTVLNAESLDELYAQIASIVQL